MRKIALALVPLAFLVVGCGSGIDGPNGEDVWYDVQTPDTGEGVPAECLLIKVTVYNGGDMDMGKDEIRTVRYCMEDS